MPTEAWWMPNIPQSVWITVAILVILFGILRLGRQWRQLQWGRVSDACSLQGRVYIVTGANSGLGYETTKALATRGAHVILACRHVGRANEAIARIRQWTANGQLTILPLDLSHAGSIRDAANNILRRYTHVDCVILNAGCKLSSHQSNADGLELTFFTNFLGHFLFAQLLDEMFEACRTRVVIVCSREHERAQLDVETVAEVRPAEVALTWWRNPYYDNSKLANFYMARELYRRDVDVFVVCPGLSWTSLIGLEELRWFHLLVLAPYLWWMLRSAEQGAQDIVWSATQAINTESVNPETGYFVSNLRPRQSRVVWDEELGDRLWTMAERMVADATCRDPVPGGGEVGAGARGGGWMEGAGAGARGGGWMAGEGAGARGGGWMEDVAEEEEDSETDA